MKSIEINSNCKINFGLNIIKKRTDGFHDIETVFYPIHLADRLTFKISESKSFTTNNERLNSEGTNLVLKAIELLEKRFNSVFNVAITLEKNIPIGAGLGGGSSNAAVALVSVAELFKLEISKEELAKLALQLGSDVPFFLKPLPCFAASRGEDLTPISFDIEYPILLINPGIHIATKWAYQNITPRQPEFSLLNLNNYKMDELPLLKDKVVNDFEEKCFAAHPKLKDIKENLYNMGAMFALMTGSGSTMFGVFPDMDSRAKGRGKV